MGSSAPSSEDASKAAKDGAQTGGDKAQEAQSSAGYVRDMILSAVFHIIAFPSQDLFADPYCLHQRLSLISSIIHPRRRLKRALR